jgi:regulator of protease activity HflC (stomatin/prohibitin superfamily)
MLCHTAPFLFSKRNSMCYFLDNLHKFVFVFAMITAYSTGTALFLTQQQVPKTEQAVGQLADDSGKTTESAKQQHIIENNGYVVGWAIIGLITFFVFIGDIRAVFKPCKSCCRMLIFGLLTLTLSGCVRPFEPIKLQVVEPNEEAFLLPYVGDAKKQSSSTNEEYLKANLVYTKQIKIPQQWVQLGYETLGPNGHWQDAAVLVKVDKSPVTREWTADPNSGTSNKNEAIWVMTSDQVEFSTGWTITARIETQADAVKFLHNYPNGSLIKVMDSEVRSKLQAVFGLEVTDLPMEKLRKEATPHILSTVKEVTEFFKLRGITITNLGISGGFIYKDKTILDTMVKVFNAEQEKAVAAAESSAQEERNKKVIFEATGKADALLKTKKAEADGIKLVADAKMYELEQAANQLQAYLSLKQLELQKELLARWDGSYPRYFMGAGNNPNMLLQLPQLEPEKK